ncbi:ribonuclease HI [Nakamurella alba]|uniref:ribonuclease HI n=1 Tax=Nakamurella alba TaxID=2665158 RepID=UPI0018AA8D77|nr:ribonuclease HI [Nakamurella alba]
MTDEPSTAPAPGAAPTSGTVEIWTDGACKGNPGVGGWGALLRSGSHEKELWGGEAVTTNNRMELFAVIQALRALKRPSDVVLHVDSTYVMKGISDWIAGWKRNGWRTAAKQPVKNDDLWRLLDEEVARHRVRWVWVKGHAGDPGNERADQLANRGVDDVRSGARS